MPDLSAITGNVDMFGMYSNILSQSIYWLTVALVSAIIIGIMIGIYYWFSFPYSMTVFPMYGSGKDGIFSFGKQKSNRIKWNKEKTAWKKMFPIGNKEEIEPFDSEYIYPGNKIFAFSLNDKLIPGRININKTEEEIRTEINPVPYYIRNWQSLQHKKHELEFAKHDWWSENKTLFITLVICGINLALCGFVIWFTYQYANSSQAEATQTLQNVASMVKGVTTIPGNAPG